MVIGFLTRDDYAARRGRLLVWEPAGFSTRPYTAALTDDLGLLFVADANDIDRLRREGLAELPLLLRQRRCDQYILKTMEALEAAGLGEFIENLGLNFPIH